MTTLLMGYKAKLKQLDNSKWFQGIVIAVILLSALLIGAKTHNIPEKIVGILMILDMSITVFFAVEILIRFTASDNKRHFFKNGWNVFDFIIVVGSLIPAGGSTVLLARLLRVFRVLRLVSMIPELRMLINALIKALPRMGYIALLMFVIFYIYAAIGSILFEKINPFLWGDVSISMLTLFRIATFEDWTDVMYETMEVFPLSWVFYVSFIFLAAFIFLNMMVGTILDVMSKEQEEQRASEHGETLEGGEPASRAQIEALEKELAEIKGILQNLTVKRQ